MSSWAMQPVVSHVLLPCSSAHPVLTSFCMHTCFSLHQFPTFALPLLLTFRPDSDSGFQRTSKDAALFSSQLLPVELLYLTRLGTKCPLCSHSEDGLGSMQVYCFSSQPCSCYGVCDNLFPSAFQQPLLHHALHLLYGPCSLPLGGLHLPHRSLDNGNYGTPHGGE